MPTGFKDTFKLWQVIKNLNDIFDGGTAGDVLVRGATEFDSDWVSPVYGEMYIQGSTTATSIGNSDTWTQVVAGWTTGTVQNATFTTDQLAVDYAGDYRIDVALSFTGFAADTFTLGIAINDTVDETSRIERKTASLDVGAIAICGIFTLAVDDSIQIYVKNQSLTNNPTITEASVVVVKL